MAGGRLSGCTNPQQKIKVSPHYYKTQARVEDRRFGMFSEILQLSLPTLAKKKKILIPSLISGASGDVCVSREHTTLPGGVNLPQVPPLRKPGQVRLSFFQKCSFQPDKFKHSDLEAPTAQVQY